MSHAHAARDPFGPAASPSDYVPRAETERALTAIEASLSAARVAALVGPPGFGKSLLLRRVALQERQLEAVYVPFCSLTLAELCSLALRLLGKADAPDPVSALAAHARARGEDASGVLLLIDDAGVMPFATAEALASLLERVGPALGLVLAAGESDAAQRVFSVFGSTLDPIRLDGPLSADEARRYVASRLAFAGADAHLCTAFDDASIDALHRASEGIPRRLNLAAQQRVREVLQEVLPGLATRAPAPAPPPPPPPRSTIAALLAQEPDVKEVVDALRDPQSAPRARVEPERAAPALPAASRGSEAREASRQHPAVEVPPAPAASAAEPPVERRESRVGTYRLTRGSGSVERPSEVPERAHPHVDTLAGETASGWAGAGAPGAGHTAHATLGNVPLVVRAERSHAGGAPRAAAAPRSRLRRALRALLLAAVSASIVGLSVGLYGLVQQRAETKGAADALRGPAALVERADAERAGRHAEPPPPVLPETDAPAAPAPLATQPTSPTPTAVLAPVPPVIVRVGINAVPWAVIEVDGVEIGETPLAGIGIAVGAHRFRARMPDGSVRERVVEIDAEHRRVVFE
ncbi:MAG: AAA family ATPase [Myxococcales bacterium]|nr:AAA family ATPase [Myxococcales bacterium]MDH5306751.1 AAA family ATPase [Myxococcales bacterium]MDH5567064.1 AAA family ATPase [Myxococcales bacterium]